MHATVRRYEGVDVSRTDELTTKVNENLIPSLSKLPGFSGYYLIEAENGVMTSISLFDTSEHGDESTRLVSNWVRDEKLEGALPNPPKITVGEVIARQANVALAPTS
jgi:hypothetical protein